VSALSGKAVLIVEDEAMIAAMLEDMLAELGATAIGPAVTIAAGLHLAQAERIDAAVLDVNIRSERIDPVVDRLRARAIPIVFATGYGAAAVGLPGDAPVIEKPYTMEKLHAALLEAMGRARGIPA
jgi:DNA-binding response OmpR family regulator